MALRKLLAWLACRIFSDMDRWDHENMTFYINDEIANLKTGPEKYKAYLDLILVEYQMATQFESFILAYFIQAPVMWFMNDFTVGEVQQFGMEFAQNAPVLMVFYHQWP